MTELPDISIVIPVYKSERTLPVLIKSTVAFLTELAITHEIILVDDCSPDSSWKCITEISKEYPSVRGIRLPKNKGQFLATLIGIERSKGQLIVNMDDDLEHPVSEISSLYNYLKSHENLKVVFGMSQRKYDIKGNCDGVQRVRNLFLNFFWNKYPTDSFRIFRREVVFRDEIFSVTSPMLEIHFKHYVREKFVGYVEVNRNPRLLGTSNYNFFSKIKLFFKYTPYFISKTLCNTQWMNKHSFGIDKNESVEYINF